MCLLKKIRPLSIHYDNLSPRDNQTFQRDFATIEIGFILSHASLLSHDFVITNSFILHRSKFCEYNP